MIFPSNVSDLCWLADGGI